MKRLTAAVAAWAAMSASLFGGGSTAWENHSFADFIKGRFDGLALSRDGRLTPAPRAELLAETGEAAVWAALPAPDGSIYLATGHRGRLLRVVNRKLETVWAAPQPEIFALAFGPDGALYAGTSPDGRIWRLQSGRAEEYFNPQAKYIWALRFGPDGALYAGTGQEGLIWRITGKAQGEIFYATGQSHVTSLAFDARKRLLAGSDPNGLLYRIESKDKGFVLYDSTLQEIRSIAAGPDGSLYVAALGAAAAQKQAKEAGAAASGFQQTPVVTTTITVTADAARTQGGLDVKPKPEAPKPQAPAEPGQSLPPVPLDIPGLEKSAIYRIAQDNTAETLWSTKDENIFDLSMAGSDIFFSTDAYGRIYRLTADGKSALVLETREGEATRLLSSAQGLLAATASLGKLFMLSQDPTPKGTYESPVHDAGNIARWGRIDWRGDAPAGAVELFTRSGNSLRPDRTWSDWARSDGAVRSPNARYIQYRVDISPKTGQPASVDSVVVNYQPHNSRPAVRSLQVTPQWGAVLTRSTAAAASSTAAYSITVSDTGDAGPQSSSGTPTQTVNRTGVQQLLISWQADDPDNDRLVYTLSYRGVDEREWKLIKGDMPENTHVLEADVFADGYYRFRVVATDKLANSAASARESELISPPVLLDQTPPSVSLGAPRKEGSATLAEISARDATSPVRRAEYAVDGMSWQPLDAVDGVADSPEEKFLLRLESLAPGEHSVVVRVYDAAGNAGLAKLVLR